MRILIYNVTMEYQYQKCKTCKHYLEHYVIRGTMYVPIGGHCINHELNPKQKKGRFALIENCEHWESDASKKSERKESIKAVLCDMKEHLEEIELILKDDE